ncbi:hypothetical protein JTB14_037785 [Gonioctena quinquepunctata]|nr:hypothetical protein JTB14_037785 [Gonioctena quinquepunctata]
MSLQHMKINLKTPLRKKKYLGNEVEKFNKDLQSTAWEECIPDTKGRLRGCNYPKEIRMLVTDIKKSGRKWLQSRTSQDITVFANPKQV